MALDLRNPADTRHLAADIVLAEDLAVRYGDVRWPPGPERRDQECLDVLFAEIADRHGIVLNDVMATRQRIADRGLSLAVNVPIVVFCALVAVAAARRVCARFPYEEEPLAAVVAAVLVAVLAGGLTMGVGALWETSVEIVRVGNTHLSYRGDRVLADPSGNEIKFTEPLPGSDD